MNAQDGTWMYGTEGRLLDVEAFEMAAVLKEQRRWELRQSTNHLNGSMLDKHGEAAPNNPQCRLVGKKFKILLLY